MRCPVHDNQKHGKEAEELRQGIEEVLTSWRGAGGEWHLSDLISDVQAVLDSVDARDSLGYLERKDAKKKKRKA